MGWRDLTIGKKISAGFSVVIVLLVLIGVMSYFGVGSIVENAQEVIEGNKLDGSLAQKEVDHLNWVNQVNALLTDEAVTTLTVQTDDHECGFGKWLFGEGRKEAEVLVPSLAPLFKEIETPHLALHHSAVDIQKVFKQPHEGLALTLADRLIDHVNWVAQLGSSLAIEAGEIQTKVFQLERSVDQAIAAIRSIDTANSHLGKETRKSEAAQLIRGMRFGKNNESYVFVLDSDVHVAVHPANPKLEGKNFTHQKDGKGKTIFSEMVQMGLEKGDGFVLYHWPMPGRNEPVPKISYVKLYEPFHWIVGIGIYLDSDDPILIERANGFVNGEPFSAGIELDPTQCAFGKFLEDPKTKALAESFPELKAALSALHDPHERLHHSASLIEEKVNQQQMDAAIKIFNQETQKALEEVKHYFHGAIDAENALQQGMNAANKIYAEETVPNLEKVQAVLNEIRQTARENIMTDQVLLDLAFGTQRNVSIVAAIAIVAALFLAFIIARGIITALTRITEGLNEAASQVAAASSQVSSSSQSLAEGASEQAASIEETSSSMEEMSSMTKLNAENSQRADRLMREANHIVTEANGAMDQLTQSMQDITSASEETSKIIKTIDEIAFQTNLLALNAAVEAARAGEAGAGFAVVADEVRNLAMRAAEAAKNTAELIEGNVVKVKEGSQLVLSTNSSFVKVMESSVKVGELISGISDASNDQSEGISQVNTAISEMDKVVQSNAANAEESASASEEMSAQAEQLRDFVGDLMMMVTGKNLSRSPRKGRQPLRSVPQRTQQVTQAKRALPSQRAGEVHPDQQISFDDKDDFENF